MRIDGIDEVVVTAQDKDKNLTALIYSDKADDEKRKSINNAVEALNRELPMYKHIGNVRFMDQPFEKTTSHKIIRRKSYD